MKLTDRDLEILCFLMDDHGHPLWEISGGLGYEEGYISKRLKILRDMGAVYHIESVSSRFGTRSPNMKEYRLFINKELNILLFIKRQVARRVNYHKSKIGTEGQRISTFQKNAEKNEMIELIDSNGMPRLVPYFDPDETISSKHQILFNEFETFSRWLTAAIARYKRTGKLDPCPLSPAEMMALIYDYDRKNEHSPK